MGLCDVIAEISEDIFALAVVHGAAMGLVRKCVAALPSEADLCTVATEYGHSVFVNSLQTSSEAADIVAQAKTLVLEQFQTRFQNRRRLLRHIKASSKFCCTTDGFSLGMQRGLPVKARIFVY